MSKLLPCPFCNETPHIGVQKGHGPQARFSYYREHVVCACGASTKLFKAPGKAVAAWNTRHTPVPCVELEAVRREFRFPMRDKWESQPNMFGMDAVEERTLVTRQNAEEVIAAKDARIKELEAKLETANALVTCCCGSLVNDHDMGSGHSPVDQYHYAMVQLEADNKRLREALETIADGNFLFPSELRFSARAALGGVKP